ncbi:MAG: endolytic transglycosylase MltG [Azospirillum sp.]|nr:endolytic transglycosylase MltG [Azospirillum sp.]
MWLASGAFIALLAAAGAALWALDIIDSPGPLAAARTLVIAHGSGVLAIASRLEEAGVLDRPLLFAAQAGLRGGDGLRAGEYAFEPAVSIAAVVEQMRRGRTVVHRLTIPEGLTTAQVVALVDAEPALAGEAGPVPAEGSLLPDTYHYSYGDRRSAVVQRMRAAMTAALTELWPARVPDLPLESPQQAVVLASIVEKETALADERARIAGVFFNRLAAGMPLQSDPTVSYAVTLGRHPLGRTLNRADLQTQSPYNTYVVTGLPPGPIANPGRAALEAVLHPDRHELIYFVADGSGGHAFARTLAEHNHNVARWRALSQQSAQRPTPATE